jgi:hypothetical protein
VARFTRLLTAALAFLFLATHLVSLPRSLEDIDTINLALGVESFDVVNHRPHPPGYPVFVAMGKLSTSFVSIVAPGLDRNERAAVGLAIWGVAAGAVFVWVLVAFWRAVGWTPLGAWFAAALAIGSPLFWFTSARPLTDATALVAATAVQWLFVRHALSANGSAAGARPVLIAAFLAGVLVGLRTQTLWLTSPLMVWAVWRQLRRGDARQAGLLVVAAAAGCLLWAVPLVISTGGLETYLAALADQGAEDFSGVEMLATSADRRLLTEALTATFIRPWRVEWLGETLGGLAIIGLVRLVWRQRTAFGFVLVAFAPYLVFHLAFQETETVRYALPLVVPVAGLAVHALFWLPVKAAATIATLLTIAVVITAQPSLSAYGRQVPPTFQALRDAEAQARAAQPPPLVVTHTGMRRVADWYRAEWPALPSLAPRDPSWLHIVDHFRMGATNPAWFLTDRRRTDVALFDRRARTEVREYLQDPDVRRLVGQARQDEVRWWQIAAPDWMLGRGWALSPEVGGLTFASGRDPHRVPAEGYLRRTEAATRLMVGGRYISGTRAAAMVVEIDGRVVSRWDIVPAQPSFLYWIDLPAGALAGDGTYATVLVRVDAAGGSGEAPRITLEQFDFAPASGVMAGFAEGWQEPETDVDTGRSWRWAGPRATMVAYAGGGPVRLTLTGESPLRYFDRPSTIVVLVEGREVTRFEASGDFVEAIEIPAGRFTVSPSRVTIEIDQMFVPAEREDSPDRRQLSQRFFSVELGRP